MFWNREPSRTRTEAPVPASHRGADGPEPGRSGPAAAGAAEILPYVAPIFAYVALGGLEAYLPQVDHQPSPRWYLLAYAARLVVVGLLTWRYRSTWSDFRPLPTLTSFALASFTGLVVTGLWVGLDGLYPAIPFLGGERVGFNPTGLAPGLRGLFIAVRMVGLVVLVPLIEELFWRSFLIRWIIDQDFQRVPIGRVTPLAAIGTAVLFALAHPEWLPALLTGLLWSGLLGQTRSLAACLISHVVANLALGLYLIISGDWKYW